MREEHVGSLHLVRTRPFARADIARATVLADFAARESENARLLEDAKIREAERARLSEQIVTAEQESVAASRSSSTMGPFSRCPGSR